MRVAPSSLALSVELDSDHVAVATRIRYAFDPFDGLTRRIDALASSCWTGLGATVLGWATKQAGSWSNPLAVWDCFRGRTPPDPSIALQVLKVL